MGRLGAANWTADVEPCFERGLVGDHECPQRESLFGLYLKERPEASSYYPGLFLLREGGGDTACMSPAAFR